MLGWAGCDGERVNLNAAPRRRRSDASRSLAWGRYKFEPILITDYNSILKGRAALVLLKIVEE